VRGETRNEAVSVMWKKHCDIAKHIKKSDIGNFVKQNIKSHNNF